MNEYAVERAGVYLSQPAGYKAFIPKPLPPSPAINLSEQLHDALSKADRALGRLDGSISTLPFPDLFVAMYVRKEAVLSSQIEGTQSSLQDLLAAEAKILSATRPSDVDEVINYVAAMNHGLARLDEIPVSVRLIKETHEKLMVGVRGEHLIPGETRTSQNWIGPAGYGINDATFVPPPPHLVAQSLGELEAFLHTESHLPLLVKIGLAHAQFETIHPFLDGNGRVGRLLITFLLCERDVLLKPVLYLSHFFKKHRQEYYESLQSVRQTGDWESWLLFFLKGVFEVSQQATDTARDILALREHHRTMISENFGRAAGNGIRVLERLYEKPLITVTEVQSLIGTTYPAANNLIKLFTNSAMLVETTGQKRNRVFMYQKYVDLFRDS